MCRSPAAWGEPQALGPSRPSAPGSPPGSQLPLHRGIARGFVGAEVAGGDCRGQMASERRMGGADAFDLGADAFADGRARPLGCRRRSAVAAAETDGGGELLGNDVDLGPRALRAARVV